MNEEPFYVVQYQHSPDLHGEWIERHSDLATQEGATFARVSTHPDDESLILFEAWKTKPEDQGELRWSLTTQ